jgi:hypothetical protein
VQITHNRLASVGRWEKLEESDLLGREP